MNERFLQYLRAKGLSQRRLSELSGVSASTVSRFCSGTQVACDKLQSMLAPCEDLSLEWLFFGRGPMLRASDCAEPPPHVSTLAEKDRLIAERDRVISERDAVICRLLGLVEKTPPNP